MEEETVTSAEEGRRRVMGGGTQLPAPLDGGRMPLSREGGRGASVVCHCSQHQRRRRRGGSTPTFSSPAAATLSETCRHVILFQIVFLIAACQAVISDDLVVETTKGKISGVTLKSATSR